MIPTHNTQSDRASVCFGYDQVVNGCCVPNGVTAERWIRLTPAEHELELEDVHFRDSRLPHFVSRAGYGVRQGAVEELAGAGCPWFYMLRPYAVPDLSPALRGMSATARRSIHSGRGYLLVDYTHEGYSWWMFQRLYSALREATFPPEKVILLSGDLRADAMHSRYVHEHGIVRPVNVHPLNYFREQVAEYLRSKGAGVERLTWSEASGVRERPRLYLNFNRRNRFHRLLTVVRLHQSGLLDRGLVSFFSEFEGRDNETVLEDEGRRYGVSQAVITELRKGYRALRPRLPLQVDVSEMATNHAHTHADWPYRQTWLSLVSETLFFESVHGQVFVSEKVWKPMMNYQPFLLIGDAGTLAALRRMGFLTFDPHINETYDSEPDHARRLEMSLGELRRLSRLTERELYDWYTGMRHILEHNFQHLRATDFAEGFNVWDHYLSAIASRNGAA